MPEPIPAPSVPPTASSIVPPLMTMLPAEPPLPEPIPAPSDELVADTVPPVISIVPTLPSSPVPSPKPEPIPAPCVEVPVIKVPPLIVIEVAEPSRPEPIPAPYVPLPVTVPFFTVTVPIDDFEPEPIPAPLVPAVAVIVPPSMSKSASDDSLASVPIPAPFVPLFTVSVPPVPSSVSPPPIFIAALSSESVVSDDVPAKCNLLSLPVPNLTIELSFLSASLLMIKLRSVRSAFSEVTTIFTFLKSLKLPSIITASSVLTVIVPVKPSSMV